MMYIQDFKKMKKMKQKEVVKKFDLAQESIHKAKSDMRDVSAELRSLELLQKRTSASIDVAKKRIQSIQETEAQAKDLLSKLNPYIAEARAIVQAEARILKQLAQITEAQTKKRKALKEFYRL